MKPFARGNEPTRMDQRGLRSDSAAHARASFAKVMAMTEIEAAQDSAANARASFAPSVRSSVRAECVVAD